MNLLDEEHFNVEIENGMKNGCLDLPFELQPETIAIQEAVKVILKGLGEDINREGIKKTPFRVAKALRQGTRGYKQKVKDFVQSALFPEKGLDDGQAGGVGGLVVIRDLDHYSYCESCLLPFRVKCHIGYVPSGGRVLGLSKFSRVADVFAKRLQEPQRLAEEICSGLQLWVEPSGVAVVLQCSHPHFPGFVEATVTSGSGSFEDESSELWCEFMSLLKFNLRRDVSVKDWCPFVIENSSKEADSGMVSAVVSILKALGEDPSRKELVSTPTRFLKWMMKFQNVNFEMKLNRFDYNLEERRLSCEMNIQFWSMCEHHLLPFYGVVHIGYFLDSKPVAPNLEFSLGLAGAYGEVFSGSKVPSPSRNFCGDGASSFHPCLGGESLHFEPLMIEQQNTAQVNGDIIVVSEAEHTCMISRGIEKFGSSTATVAVL
ncbi:hypothetical protein F2Q69_00024728, partial [Brassica cretica]